MSERKFEICKRDSKETKLEESSIKRIKLDDDLAFRSSSRTISSSSSSSSSSLAYFASDSRSFPAALSSLSSGCCSSEETHEIVTNTRLQFSDLEKVNQISETEISTLINNKFRNQVRETSEMDSATTERNDREKPEKTEKKSPTKAELDDFFSAAEKYEQKRFSEKYNYDIVNDTPREGRYQWVALKP